MDSGHGSDDHKRDETPVSPLRSIVLLVVDDELHIIELLKAFLEAEGYVVVSASTGLHAIQVTQQVTLALVLTDYLMPHLDGLKLRRHLLANSATATIPVMLLSAAPPDHDTELFATVVKKPFMLEDILA